MRIEALKHMALAITSLAPGMKLIVFGLASALGTYPDLCETTDAYEKTQDADFIFEPWDEKLGLILRESLGKESLFFDHYEYYADINRPVIFDNFPPDFRDRLVPLEGCPNVWALDPHDMAVAKLWAGRPKDLKLITVLLATNRLDEAKVRRLLWSIDMEEKWIVKTHAFLDEVVKAARELGYSKKDVRDTWKNS